LKNFTEFSFLQFEGYKANWQDMWWWPSRDYRECSWSGPVLRVCWCDGVPLLSGCLSSLCSVWQCLPKIQRLYLWCMYALTYFRTDM